ncbi:MAG: M20/M25/M40 family metallo-hydrolase [Gemmatimonadales bacterium]
MDKFGRQSLAFIAGMALAGCQAAPGKLPLDHDIVAGDMRARISFLASDLLLGRATPSRGLDIAANYVQAEFARFGLESPRGGLLQRYQLAASEISPGWNLVLRRSGRSVALRHREDFWGVPWTAGRVEGDARFVGARLPTTAGLTGETVWIAYLTHSSTPRAWLEAATRAGAVGLVLVVAGEVGPHVQDWLEEGEPVYELGEVEARLPAVLLLEESLVAALERLGVPVEPALDSSAPGRHEMRIELSAVLSAETVTAPNVIGILPGGDRRLREEFVLLSAHMDGLGVGPAVNGDSIYNGADDNASGTAAILEVAEALASLPERPRRSVAFLALSGEERGLLGSAAFVENPPIPLDRIVANVNLDMVGRNWEDTISVIGKPYSTLGTLVDSVAAAHPELRMAVVGDRWPSQGFFFRSDHFNFARKGIPAVFFFNGVHEDYHQPSDEVDKIKFEKAARIGRLVLETVLAIANAEEAPRWDSDARRAIVEGAR